MSGQYVQTMETFADRLKQAALYRRVDYSPTAIGRALGLRKQTVHRWMKLGGEPTAEHVYLIADTWDIDARWLATGEGYMIRPPSDAGLNRQELDLIAAYRRAHPDGKNSMRAVAKAIGKGALVLLMALGLSAPQPADAALFSPVAAYVYYVKSLLRRIRLSYQEFRSRLSSLASI